VAQQKEGIAVKSGRSWHNKKWRRGKFRKIVAQQKDGIVVNSEISWQSERFSAPF